MNLKELIKCVKTFQNWISLLGLLKRKKQTGESFTAKYHIKQILNWLS